ncbi:MAG: VOC family protein [Pseudomonadota bacterium]|nr:VOC family protein [Pseudomonadota bacterium]
MTHGAFVWHDLMCTDPAAAAGFYAELFGWTCKNGRFLREGTPVAGIVALDPDLGWPSHWLPYVAVDDVDAAVGKGMAHGGMPLLPPADAPDSAAGSGGRFAVLADPGGAAFGLVRGSAPAVATGVGAITWDELLTDDDAVRSFYARALGYAVGVADMGPLGAGWALKAGGEARASILASPLATPPIWVAYVSVADVGAVLAKVEPLGGRVVLAAVEIEGVGTVALVEDPTGAIVGLLG